MLVDIYALQGRSRFKPRLSIGGNQIPLDRIIRQTDAPVFKVDDFGFNLNNATSLRVDHEDGASHTVSITQDTPPQVTSATFNGSYPGTQTELKFNDSFNFTVNSNVPVVSAQIDDFGALQSSTVTFPASTTRSFTVFIANRGTTTQDLGARVRVQKANGSWSDWFLTTSQGSTNGVHTLKLNNTSPSISITAITYPAIQGALKDSESATVSNTVSNFDTISYESVNGDLTITSPSLYQSSKSVTRAAGNYNIGTNNFRIIATRTANNAVANSSTVVRIAHTAPTLTVSVPAARLRTGGNDGTSLPSYTVTITASQQLLSAPTLSAPSGGGTLVGSFSGSGTTWTSSLQISDSLVKGTYNWASISATNLAGKVVSTTTTGGSYVIGCNYNTEFELPLQTTPKKYLPNPGNLQPYSYFL